MKRAGLLALLLALASSPAFAMPVNDASQEPRSADATTRFVDQVVQKRQAAQAAYARMKKKREKAIKAAVARADAPAAVGLGGKKRAGGPARPAARHAAAAVRKGGHTFTYVLLTLAAGVLLFAAFRFPRRTSTVPAQPPSPKRSGPATGLNRGEPHRPRMPKIR